MIQSCYTHDLWIFRHGSGINLHCQTLTSKDNVQSADELVYHLVESDIELLIVMVPDSFRQLDHDALNVECSFCSSETTDACLGNRCSHICVPTHALATNYVCLCPEASFLTLDQSSTTCSGEDRVTDVPLSLHLQNDKENST